SYTVTNATAADAGLYSVTVSNAYGSVTSSPATVTVTTPQPQAPVFTLQPASVAAPAGSSRTFSIAVSGYPIPALQWLKNGVRLTGQTRETLTLSNISTADAATYTCEATNTSGTTVSQSAVLAVGQAPVVVKALPVTTVEAKIGDPLRIDLPPLGGTGPFLYRWALDSNVFPKFGDSSLQISALTSAGAGLYSCYVINNYGDVRIDRVRVTLIEAPRITTQPQSATIAASGSATFRVTVSGTPAPTYQWYRNELPLSGQTATQITVSGSPATQTVGGYYCVVTNRAGSVRSATAGLTVSAGTTTTPSITRTVQQQEIGRSVMLADSDPVFVPGLGQVYASYSTFSASGSGTDRTTSGALSYNNELRPRAGSAKDYEANFVRRTPLGMVDYGNFVVSLPTNDTDGNGINDAFEYRQNGTATALGSGYDYANGTPFSIELRFTRAAGEVKGRYAAKTTTLTGISAEVSGDFYVSGPNGIRIGSTTYVRGASSVMNVSLAPDATLTNNTGTPYSGSFGFTVTDRDTVAYNAFDLTGSPGFKYSVRAGTLKRNGRVYGGTLSYVDGQISTAFADYVSSYFTITDPNDADGDGIPDLTDDLPAPPALASFSGTAQTLQTGARLEFTATAQGTGIFVWKKDGVVIRTSASTSADTLTIPSVARTDTGSYWVELTNGGGTSASAVVPVVVSANDALPIITGQPVAAQVSTGSNLILTVDALAGSSPRFQWRKDGVDIPGATGSSFGKVSLNTTEAGHYSVLVTNDAGATVSQLASVSYSASNEAIPLLSNLSVRTQLQPNVPLIVGAVVSGTGKPLLMRAAGPALEKFGLQGVRESEMKLYDPSQNVIATKQGWDPSLDTIFPLVGAFPFTAGSKDSAVVRSMGGAFTLHTVAQSAGAALVELYDATGGTGQRLVNLSVRNRVGADSDILIVGLAVGGVGRINLLLRAVGPTLGSFGVTGTLDDPKITIYGPSGAVLAANDNWSAELTPVFARVGAFGLAAGSRDAALLFSADAGSVYTVHVAGVNNTTGEALVEVYEVP
ncbi:MAG: immunoglobulin domain-containing protein, partial [Verrucomicrobiota bacterium]